MAGPSNTHFAVAVHVLTYLAGADDHPVSSDELAASANVNPVYVRRVLGPLRQAGLVRSRPGAHGGWELVRPAHRIRLDEVWDLINPDAVIATHGPNPACPVGRQIQSELELIQDELAATVRRQLHRRTVAGLLPEPRRRAVPTN